MSESDTCGTSPANPASAEGFDPAKNRDAHGHDHGGDEEDGLPRLSALAAEKVLEIRGAEGIEEDMALRLRVVGGGCSGFSYDLYFDAKNELDREIDSYGVRLVVDQMSLMYLMGTEIDYVEGLAGAGFKFHNPNVKSTCGCGSSFQV